jgi:FkbM family methyltransferase
MNDLGILVFGHRRAGLMRNLLESLRRQGVLDRTQVWVDGIAHAAEITPKVEAVRALRREFPTARWTNCHGRLGIEKLMLDGLTEMARRHRDIVVLEDDCFPTADAIEVFRSTLDDVRGDAGIYSVYGNPFGTEGEAEVFPRFQGWGWATTRDKLLPVLAQLKSMFMMSEPDYLAWVAKVMTPAIKSRLDVTGRRNVTAVLERQFSWDSATALLTALLGLQHRRTPHRVVYNCGAGEDSGHFRAQVDEYRAPPFNMIGANEVWQHFNGPPEPRYRGRQWFGLDELDRKLEQFITAPTGTFVELGAFDGLDQTNTLWLERRGWRGVLIEAVPEFAEACRKNRPLSQVVHAACVSHEQAGSEVELHQVGLMSVMEGTRAAGDLEAWIRRGEEVQKITRGHCRAPARTLSSILEDAGVQRVDFLSLDVEGAELAVLEGLDWSRHAPTWLLIEDSGQGSLTERLAAHGYSVASVLNVRPFTRDLLLRRDVPEATEAIAAARTQHPTVLSNGLDQKERNTLAQKVSIEIDFPPTFAVRWGRGRPSATFIEKIFSDQLNVQMEFLESLKEFVPNLAAIDVKAQSDTEPHWEQVWFPPLDGMSLYTLLAKHRPKNYVEIGSGNSTKFAHRAIKDHGLDTRITSIDPHPRAEIDALSKEVLRQGLENVDLSLFEAMLPGDVLLFDGSHRSFMNSDVSVFFIDVLPRLRPGIIVGVHDIFWPDDYPEHWIDRHYNEQYLLGAYLLARGPALQMVLSCYWMATRHPEYVASLLSEPLKANIKAARKGIGGGCCWFKT